MAAHQDNIARLRAVLAPAGTVQPRLGLGVPRLDALLGGGLRRGALHEVFAPPSHEAAATGFAAGMVRRLAGPVLWIGLDFGFLEHGQLAATGLMELGLSPERLILARVPDAASALRAAMEGLATPALAAVVVELVGEPKLLNLVAYRKLVLAAGESGVTVLLLRFSAHPSLGVADTRWQVWAAPSPEGHDWGPPVFEVELQRNRAGAGGLFRILWSGDDGCFRDAADRGLVVSPAAN